MEAKKKTIDANSFAKWMNKIKNIYQHDNERMLNAFEKINNEVKKRDLL
jgi:DNA-binding transcriptional MocR family regulator